MRSYGKILRRVLAGFLIVYIMMMGVFTWSKVLDIKREYRNQVYNILFKLTDEVKEAVLETTNTYELTYQLNTLLTDSVEFTEEFQIYGVAQVFQSGECIAQSGNYLVNPGIDWNLNSLPEGESYIDLEKYFSPDEQIQFIQLLRKASTDEVLSDWIKVEGYRKGREVRPKSIQYDVIEQRKGEFPGWYDEDAQTAKIYQFEAPAEENWEQYKMDQWNLRGTFRSDVSLKYPMTRQVLERLQQLEDKIAERQQQVGYEWQDGLFEKSRYVTYQGIETDKGIYGLGLGMEYEPWRIALGELDSVYLFSVIVVGLMSIILTNGLWKNEKQQQLIEKNRRDLVDAIGHELKTPLGIVQAYSEGLKENIAEEKREYYAEVIIDETQRMNELILQMLELSKFESKAYQLKKEHFSLSQLIKDSLKNKYKLIEDKSIEMTVKIDGEWEIIADYKCMEQVLNNLIFNAVEHTPEGGKIVVAIHEARVSIYNEGAPIPKEKMDLIWEPFYKGEEVNNRSGRGSGLGLSIVKNILELHGIMFGVSNEGQGVVFWFEVNNDLIVTPKSNN